LQLKNDGVAIREIARRTGISRNAVKRYLLRLEPPFGDPPIVNSGHVDPPFRDVDPPAQQALIVRAK